MLKRIWERIKNNPVRVATGVGAGLVAIGAAVGVDISGIVGVGLTIIGIAFGGEAVRAKVTPTRKLRR